MVGGGHGKQERWQYDAAASGGAGGGGGGSSGSDWLHAEIKTIGVVVLALQCPIGVSLNQNRLVPFMYVATQDRHCSHASKLRKSEAARHPRRSARSSMLLRWGRWSQAPAVSAAGCWRCCARRAFCPSDRSRQACVAILLLLLLECHDVPEHRTHKHSRTAVRCNKPPAQCAH
jgi:hypothetical protein